MRYEAIRLVQFVFSMCLILGAFLFGLYLGWRRWGRPGRDLQTVADAAGRTQHSSDDPWGVGAASRRHDLFAPEFGSGLVGEVDLREVDTVIRGELPSGAPVRPT